MNENESLTENSMDQDNSKPGRSVSISVKILAVTLGTTLIVSGGFRNSRLHDVAYCYRG